MLKSYCWWRTPAAALFSTSPRCPRSDPQVRAALRHDGVRKTFLLKWQKLPIHSIASIAMHCNSGIARECKIATDSTRRHKEHKEKPSFASCKICLLGNDKTFRDFCQTFWTFWAIWQRNQSWEAGLELPDHEIHCIGGDLREYLQTSRPIVYHPYYWQVATCTSTTARKGLMRGNRRTVTHGVRSFIRWGFTCSS